MRRLLARTLAALLCATAFTASGAADCRDDAAMPTAAEQAVSGADFAAAMQMYERNQWPQAYAALARLADLGHAEAARIALQMWQWGPVLYRTEFAASAERRARWAWVWNCTTVRVDPVAGQAGRS
jgi:hypothetical protein